MIEGLTITRIGNTDDVIVSGLVDGVAVEVHVWYSHLYGENERSLHGDVTAIRAYVEQELIAAAPPVNKAIEL